ncbi:ubiquitin-associated protein 2-like isoform X2 [Ylistrum balloti]|uniref:ubiquitin-associated protein 2-like isoform X2 n=1 Tax=Ylistrum balloti TaxID=509963 RepID=UPI002905CAB1|nr:ubiquitin-associated protein 2-like isoform X2 [Ylistrum balloti]
MMSTAVSASRASNRPSKDKNAKAASRPQVKTDESSSKMHQATPEQLRIAQISQISEDETIFRQKVQQIIDLTGKAQVECEIALHDCQQDTEGAINMLLEGENYQGEWRETGGKKKKRANPSNKTEPPQNNVDEKPDKTEQNFEPRERPDRSGDNRPESSSRRGRRFDSRPPRLARGRGRERGDGGFRGNRENTNDHDNKENGFGTFDKDRDTDNRGRGRGRGRGGPRRGGRGSFNRNPRFDKGPQIDTWTNETAANAEKENAASHWESMEDWNDDTWTGSLSETKVFTATTTQEDQISENTTPMADTTNTLGQRLDLGALLQKPTSEPPESAYITQYNQQATESIKNSIGIGSSPRQNLTNQLGGSALTNHMQSGSLSSQLPSSSLSNQLSVSQQSSSDAINALVSSFGQNQTSYSQSPAGFSQSVAAYSQSPPGYSQTATGFSQGQATYSQSPSSVYSQNQSSAYSQSQSSGFSQNTGSVYSSSLEQNSGGQVDPVPSSQSGLQQRPKSQRTKLPPPSKIPASAVEMPGHMTTRLDVQFGTWEFGSDNASPFSFGGESSVTSNMSSSDACSTTQTISGHLPPQQVSSKPSESVISSSIMTTPPANSTSAMSGGDQTSPRTNIFQASPYTTPTKKDSASRSQNKMSPPEPIPFPPSQSDRKSSPMINSQHPGSSSSLTSGPLATSKPDSSNLSSYSPSTQGYASTTYPSQKTGLSTNSGRSSATGLSSSAGLSNAAGLSNSTGITNNSGLSNSAGLSSASGFSHSSSSQPGSYQNQYQTGSNQYQTSQNQFPSGQTQYQSGQNQYQSGQNQFHSGQTQFQNYGQSAGSSFQNASSYSSGSGSYSGSSQQNQGNLYQSSATNSYQSHSNQNSLYHQGNSSQTTSYQPQTNSSSFHGARDSQAGSYPTSVSRDSQSASFQASVSQSGSYPASGSRDSQTGTSFQASVTQSSATSYQRDSQSALSTPATQTQSVYTTSQGYGASPHQNSLPSNLQTSPLSGVSANKISETLSKMTVKDSPLDTRQSPQYDSSTSTTTSNLTTTTITTSLATGTTTPLSVASTSALTTTVGSTKVMTAPSTSTTKNTPSLPPGVLVGHQYIMGQGTMPQYFGLQQPLYASYTDEIQLQLQQRLPPTLANYNYDMTGFGVPTTMTGREQTTLANVPYSAADNKIGRVDAQSPIPASQQQSTQSAHQQQHFINVPYGYYYPSVLPSGFQYPAQMFPVPPVTNTAHAGTTANTQYQKTYGASHAYASNKGGYEDLTQGTDFSKSSYGNPPQNKVSGVSGSVASVPGAADMPGSGYGKSHTQMILLTDKVKKYPHRSSSEAFDKQGFHAGTPPPFNLPLATGTQAGPLGAPTTPYGAAPFMNVPMMPPHNQMLHPNMQQDSTTGSTRGSHVHSQQNSTQAKAGGAKAYGNTNWNY